MNRSRIRSRRADGALGYWATLVTDPEPVTRTVEEVTGVPARTFREWATDHVDDFRGLSIEEVADPMADGLIVREEVYDHDRPPAVG